MRLILLCCAIAAASGCDTEVRPDLAILADLQDRIQKVESGGTCSDDIAAIKNDIADVRRVLAIHAAEVRGLRDSVAKVAVAKVPHLAVRETGEDLGPWHGELVSYSPKYNAPVDWSVFFDAIYPNPNCTGDVVALYSNVDRLTVGGLVVFDRETGAAVYEGVQDFDGSDSSRIIGGKCSSFPLGMSRRHTLRLTRDGVASPSPQSIAVELR